MNHSFLAGEVCHRERHRQSGPGAPGLHSKIPQAEACGYFWGFAAGFGPTVGSTPGMGTVPGGSSIASGSFVNGLFMANHMRFHRLGFGLGAKGNSGGAMNSVIGTTFWLRAGLGFTAPAGVSEPDGCSAIATAPSPNHAASTACRSAFMAPCPSLNRSFGREGR